MDMREHIINFVTFLGIMGIPTIFSMTIWCIKECHSFANKFNILMSAQKAQMRSQLLLQYKEYMAKGWIDTEDLDDWENQYKAYHELVGDNGVLTNKRQRLMDLPDSEPAPTIDLGV